MTFRVLYNEIGDKILVRKTRNILVCVDVVEKESEILEVKCFGYRVLESKARYWAVVP